MSEYNFRKYNRKSLRLRGYDYTTPGYYFITMCTINRYHLFGDILNKQIQLSKYGKIAHREWLKTEELRDNVKLDAYVIMPNHIHGIIQLIGSWDTARRVPTKEKFGKPTKSSIPTIIRSYKSAVTKSINEINDQPGDKVWQPNYYERIIRDQHELNRIREYIRKNPQNWEKDKLYT